MNIASEHGENHDDIEISPDLEEGFADPEKKIKKLKESLTQCEKERSEYLDGWQRARAEFINYKKDEEARLRDIARFAVKSMLEDLLPVLDSFEAALRNVQHSTLNVQQEIGQGFFLVQSQLMDVLKNQGVSVIEASKGDQFNPEQHESLGEVESDAPPGTVAEVAQKGYVLKERVIRPARVRLAK